MEGSPEGSGKKLIAATRALYWERPSDADLLQIGLKAKHYPEPDVVVWPENWDAVQMFSRLSTQWRIGASGPAALDYPVFYREMDRAGITGGEVDEFMWRIGVIEAEALKQIHKK